MNFGSFLSHLVILVLGPVLPSAPSFTTFKERLQLLSNPLVSEQANPAEHATHNTAARHCRYHKTEIGELRIGRPLFYCIYNRKSSSTCTYFVDPLIPRLVHQK